MRTSMIDVGARRGSRRTVSRRVHLSPCGAAVREGGWRACDTLCRPCFRVHRPRRSEGRRNLGAIVVEHQTLRIEVAGEMAGVPSGTVMTPAFAKVLASDVYVWGWPIVRILSC